MKKLIFKLRYKRFYRCTCCTHGIVYGGVLCENCEGKVFILKRGNGYKKSCDLPLSNFDINTIPI